MPGPVRRRPVLQGLLRSVLRAAGPGPPEEFRQPGLGSGVIIDKRGYVLTNFHVIRGADAVTVRLSSKQEYPGPHRGHRPQDGSGRRPLPAGAATSRSPRSATPTPLRVGEWAIAIGNPFGLDQTVTVGVVSATGRADVGIATYENFIQTDASINPGNSGGPLVNLRGEVIGINTAIVATGQGIGFAIPANMAKRVTSQLIDRGQGDAGLDRRVAAAARRRELAQALGLSEHARRHRRARAIPAARPPRPASQPNDVIVELRRHPGRRLSPPAAARPPTPRSARRVKLEIIRKRDQQDARPEDRRIPRLLRPPCPLLRPGLRLPSPTRAR